MRQSPEFFGERLMALVFIGKKLNESLAIETALDAAGIDYAVEVDYYTGGVIFRRERAGAFFYVEEAEHTRAAGALRAQGYEPLDLQKDLLPPPPQISD